MIHLPSNCFCRAGLFGRSALQLRAYQLLDRQLHLPQSVRLAVRGLRPRLLAGKRRRPNPKRGVAYLTGRFQRFRIANCMAVLGRSPSPKYVRGRKIYVMLLQYETNERHKPKAKQHARGLCWGKKNVTPGIWHIANPNRVVTFECFLVGCGLALNV